MSGIKRIDIVYVGTAVVIAIAAGLSFDRMQSDYEPQYADTADYKTPCMHEVTKRVADNSSLGYTDTTETIMGVNNGDTAMMMFGTTLVMFQTPAIGIAQAGVIRRKHSLSMMMQCVAGMAVGSICWYLWGYGLTFGPDVGGIIGNPIPFLFLNDMPYDATTCLSIAPSIPAPLFVSFQMMFALMTPVICTGAWAEKFKMDSFFIFMVLWPILVYYPAAHWLWGGGFLYELGAVDFAGGVTIHTTAGFAGLVIALMLPKRRFAYKTSMHNVSLLVIGGSIIWAGWYSFNGCSALVAGDTSSAALLNTHMSASVAGMTWVLLTYRSDNCFHVTDMMNGAFAGLAGITPGSGFVTSQAAFCTGLIVGVASWNGCRYFKEVLKIDDVLDCFSLQAIPGMVGTILVGFFAGGLGSSGDDPDSLGIFFGGNGYLLGVQILSVVMGIIISVIGTFITMKVIMTLTDTRITWRIENLGLDATEIGEYGYDVVIEDERLGEEYITEELCNAASNGDLEVLKQALLKDDANLFSPDYDGRTPLHLAASEGHLEIVKFIVEKAKSASSSLKKDKSNQFIDLHQVVNGEDNFGGNATMYSLSNGHPEVHNFLTQNGGNMDVVKLIPMLYEAVQHKRINVVKSIFELYKLRVDVNTKDYDNRSLLHVSVSNKDLALSRFLVSQGADQTIKDRWGQKPIDYCQDNDFIAKFVGKSTDPVEELDSSKPVVASVIPVSSPTKKSSASVHPVLDSGEGPHHGDIRITQEILLLCSSGDIIYLKEMDFTKQQLEASDYDYRTPLHVAASKANLPILKYLLEVKGVNRHVQDRFGRTALDDAISGDLSRPSLHQVIERQEVVRYLRDQGVTCFVDYRTGYLVCEAAANGDIDTLKAIQQKGLNLFTCDYDGRTALHLAVCNSQYNVVDYLLNEKMRAGHKELQDYVHQGDKITKKSAFDYLTQKAEDQLLRSKKRLQWNNYVKIYRLVKEFLNEDNVKAAPDQEMKSSD